MAKRKSNSATPSSQRKRKSKSRQSTASSALPEVFDDDIEQSFDNSEGISQSLFGNVWSNLESYYLRETFLVLTISRNIHVCTEWVKSY